MLSRKNRLIQKKDFEKVKASGKRFQGRFFGVLVLKTENNFSRFGFIFSTRLTKKATLRNRTKRIFREAVRKLLPRMKSGYDIIFLGRKEALEKPFLEIFREIEKVFRQAEILE